MAWKDEIRPQFRPDQDNFLDQTAIFSTGVAREAGLPGAGATIDNLDNIPIDAVSSLKELAAPWFSDQILPFDITLAATNEVGAASAMRAARTRSGALSGRFATSENHCQQMGLRMNIRPCLCGGERDC